VQHSQAQFELEAYLSFVWVLRIFKEGSCDVGMIYKLTESIKV